MATPRRTSIGGIILVILGILFLLDNLGYASFGDLISTYWPLILIIIGANILRHARSEEASPGMKSESAVFADTSQELQSDSIHHSSVFGDVELKVVSTEFRGGNVSNVFGDTNLDLSTIQLAEGESTLRISGVFGDLHILVPKDLSISAGVRTVFGDVRVLGNSRSGIGQEISYSAPGYSSSPRRLRIFASQVFGDVRVW